MSKNTRAAYWQWRRTADGARAWQAIVERLNHARDAGARRISTKALVEAVRTALRVEVNNSYTAFIADELIERWPVLEPIIERRRRKLA